MANWRTTIETAVNEIKSKATNTFSFIGTKLNELNSTIEALINDAQTAATTVWSSQKTSSELSEKVDKIAGKGLSDENYTTAEKSKLAGLESSKFKGTHPSLQALLDEWPENNDNGDDWHNNQGGFYADVDDVGEDVVRYIWDATELVWVEQIGASTQLTGSQIKQLYESEPDTNALTDNKDAKLAGIESGAQVNTVNSVAGKQGDVTLTKDDVGLSNVDNESLLAYKNEQLATIVVPDWENDLSNQLNF